MQMLFANNLDFLQYVSVQFPTIFIACSFTNVPFFTESDAISKVSYGFGNPIVWDNIMCDGSEEHILDCTNSETDTHNCSVGAAAVLCAGTIIRY